MQLMRQSPSAVSYILVRSLWPVAGFGSSQVLSVETPR